MPGTRPAQARAGTDARPPEQGSVGLRRGAAHAVTGHPGPVGLGLVDPRRHVLARAGQLQRVAGGVAIVVIAVAHAGARAAFDLGKTEPAQSFARCFDVSVRNIRNDKILPDREPNLARPIEVGDFRDASRTVFMPLGFFAGGTVPGAQGPLVDLGASFSFPIFLTGSSRDNPNSELWFLGLTARGFFYL